MAKSVQAVANRALEKVKTTWDEAFARIASMEFQWDKAIVVAVTEVETQLDKALLVKDALDVKLAKALAWEKAIEKALTEAKAWQAEEEVRKEVENEVVVKLY